MHVKRLAAEGCPTCANLSLLAQLHGACAFVQVKQLAAEVVAHLRETVGADALLEAFNAARQSVTSLRAERKRQAAVKVSEVHSASSLDVLEGCKGSWETRGTAKKMSATAPHLSDIQPG